jgi:nucleotide-binding universal stress UspA family protein
MTTRRFGILVATDGSPSARQAVGAAVAFPWPAGSRADGVVARRFPLALPEPVGDAATDLVRRAARRAEAVLRQRWPAARVVVVDRAPVDAILGEARRRGARVIVMGSRGHGLWSRLVLGSVSRGVVRRATGAVLVVKARLGRPRRLLVGLDASARSHRIVGFLAALAPSTGTRLRLLTVVESVRPASLALLPAATRALVAERAKAAEAAATRAARRRLDAARGPLVRAGFAVEAEVRGGVPLDELIADVSTLRPDVLVVGARRVGGIERLLLGSVAQGALARSPVSVLVVR